MSPRVLLFLHLALADGGCEFSTAQFDAASISSGAHVTYSGTTLVDFTANAQLTATLAIVCFRRASPTPRGVCELLTLNGALAPSSEGAVGTSIYGGATTGNEIAMTRLSETAAIVCSHASAGHYCHGLSVSGTTLSVSSGYAVGERDRANVAMTGVDATRAILCYYDSPTYVCTCVLVAHDASDNSLSFGTELSLPQSTSNQQYRPKHLTMLSASTALLAISEYSILDYNGVVLSITGDTTLSVLRTGDLTPSSVLIGIDPRVARVDSNTAINCFGDQTNSGLGGTWCVVVDV